MDGYRQRRETHGGECCWDGLRCLDILLIFVCLFVIFCFFLLSRVHVYTFFSVFRCSRTEYFTGWGEGGGGVEVDFP